MTKWLDVARAYEGQREIAGSGSNPTILGWIQKHGRPDWRDDSTIAYCGFAMAGWFTEAGMADAVPREPGAAANWRQVGEPLQTPKIGAIVITPRYDAHNPNAAHVGLVADFDAHHILIFAANQGNAVNVASIERRDAIYSYRWPIKTKTPADLAATSRIAAAAQRQKRDATVSGAGTTATQVPNPLSGPSAPPQGAGRQAVETALGEVTWIKKTASTMADFATFAAVKWQWVALGVALYFGARFLWDSHLIAKFRAEDHNEGYTT